MGGYGNDPVLDLCTFKNNTATDGGAVYVESSSKPTVVNCRFLANTADEDGGAFYSRDGRITCGNCLFSANSSGINGGVIYSWSSYSRWTMVNCTFTGNSAEGQGGGLYNQYPNSYQTLHNSVLWDNSDSGGSGESAQIHVNSGSPTVGYSCIQGLEAFAGNGNIGSDPLFVDPRGPDAQPGTEDDDLRLEPGSPCIDAAENAAVLEDQADLDGDGDVTERTPLYLAAGPRFVDDPCTWDSGVSDPPDYLRIVDMGAYEYRPFDVDCDRDVDLLDFAAFQECFTGEGPDAVVPSCESLDADKDDDVDLRDLSAFLHVLSGP